MRGFVLTLCSTALLVTFTSAQTTPAAPKKTPSKSSTATTPVSGTKAATTNGAKAAITLDHVCPPGAPGGKAFDASCKTIITEAELDKLIEALNPEMTPNVKQQLGRSLAEWTAYSARARELGLDKTTDFAEVVRFAKTQLLSQALARRVQANADKTSPADLQNYYDAHKQDFEEFNFLRVVIPRQPSTKEKPVDEAAEKQYADQLRDRLAKGEDAKTLQSEAFKRSSEGMQEPSVEINGRKRGSVPPTQMAIFDLKAGETSPAFADPSAFIIYKLVSHTTTPFDKAAEQVKRALVKQRLDAAVAELNAQFSVKLSDSYFGPQSEGPPRGAPSMTSPRGKVPSSAPAGAAPASTPKQEAPATPPVPKQ